jgi:hypothetical protein
MPLNRWPGPQALIPALRARLVKYTSLRPCWSWVCELGRVVERDHKGLTTSSTRRVWDVSLGYPFK